MESLHHHYTRCTTAKCASCFRDGDVETSTHWCVDCSEPLCFGCTKYHRKSKATRKHKMITMQNLGELSPAVIGISYKCKVHSDQSLAFFCPSHDTMCCVKCIPEIHKYCDRLITLDNEAENVKRSNYLSTLEKRLLETKNKMAELVKKKYENKTAIHEQKSRIQDEIKNVRKRIKDHFDKLESHLCFTLERAHDTCVKTLEEGIRQIDERIRKMDVWYNDIITLKKIASDVHVFTVVKTVGPLQNKQEAYFNTLQDEFIKYNIEFIEEEAWRHLIAEVPTFGEISVTETNHMKAKEYLRFKRNEFANKLVAEQNFIFTTNKKFIFSSSKLDKGTKIRSACFLPDDRLALASFHDNFIYICNKDGEKKKRISLPFKVNDLTNFDKQNIIVATGPSIQVCNSDTFVVTEHLSNILNDVIASANNLIAVRSPSGTISVLDKSGKVHRELQERSYGYIAIDRFGRVYYTNNAKNEVYCFYPGGSRYCIYRNEDLKDPSGMTTDDAGNLYVAGHLSHNIHKISAQGKHHEVILSFKDGIHLPQRIVFNDKTKELLVINNEWRSIEIYQLP